MKFSQEAISRWEAYINDWPLFAREYLRVNLDEEQEAALRAIQFNPKVVIVSGTSRGKDYVMAVAAICFMYLTPRWDETGKLIANTKVILTAPTSRQVKEIMMPEISRVFKNSVYLPGSLTGFKISTQYEEWFLSAFKADNNTTEAWTGIHAANVFIGVTEGTGIKDLIYNAMEGNLQGNSRLAIAMNYNVDHGYAANATKSPDFVTIRLNSLNAPNVKAKKIIHPGQVDYDWIVARIRDWCRPIKENEVLIENGDFLFENAYYRPNDLFRIKVLGLSPMVSEGVLIPSAWVEAAFSRWKAMQVDHITTPQGISGSSGEVIKKTKPNRLGIDVAGMGRDKTVFLHRYGNYVDKIEASQSSNDTVHMEVTGRAIRIMQETSTEFTGLHTQAFWDTIGEGAGCYSRMAELAKDDPKHAWLKKRFHSVKFSEAAEHNGQPLHDKSGQREFLNMRAFLFWAIRDWLDPANKMDAALPPDEELKRDLTEIKWLYTSNGKIKLESKDDIKKRLKRSPDKGDALANTFYPVPDILPGPGKQMNLAQIASVFA